jgi:hypothetical protein
MFQPMTGGGLRVECVPLKGIITWAYEVQNYQLSGGPDCRIRALEHLGQGTLR